MAKPVNKWEPVIWVSAAMVLVGMVLIGPVRGNWHDAWGLLCVAVTELGAAGALRLQGRQQHNED